jgi:hypothetical protein
MKFTKNISKACLSLLVLYQKEGLIIVVDQENFNLDIASTMDHDSNSKLLEDASLLEDYLFDANNVETQIMINLELQEKFGILIINDPAGVRVICNMETDQAKILLKTAAEKLPTTESYLEKVENKEFPNYRLN